MGVNARSNEQAHARRAGCECPRMALGRRIDHVKISGIVAEASKASFTRHTSESWYPERFLKLLDSGFRGNDEFEVCQHFNSLQVAKRAYLA